MIENRYTYLARRPRAPLTTDYETSTPETVFERQVQQLYLEGQEHLQHEEFTLALDRFRELMALILRTAHPQMPVDPSRLFGVKFPMDVALVDALASRAAEMLKHIPVSSYEFPPTLVSGSSVLPAASVERLKTVLTQDLQFASHHGFVKEQHDAALAAIEAENYAGAAALYRAALEKTPATDLLLRGSLLHDLGVLFEKAGKPDDAQGAASRSVEAFQAAGRADAQVQALDTATGIFQRAGKADQAKAFATQAGDIRSKVNINPVVTRPVSRALLNTEANSRLRAEVGPVFAADAGLAAAAAAGAPSTPVAPQLIGLALIPPDQMAKRFTVNGDTSAATIALDGNAAANVRAFHQTLATTTD
jgi:tetratricopeptide (TPR) repeat protein